MTAIRKYGLATLTALIAVALILAIYFGSPSVPSAPDTNGIVGTDNNPITAVCISDLSELNTLERVNYTSGDYVMPQNEVRGSVVETDSHIAAEKGTYEFVFLNLDPQDNDFYNKAAALKPFLQGDNRWHFTLCIPKIFSACNVYVRTVLTERVGELSDYNFIEHSEYIGETVYHKTKTEPLFIDLSFYTDRVSIYPDNRLRAATVVTIHYESAQGRKAGLDGVPLIGTEKEVRAAVNRDRSLLTASIIISALILAVFVFLCFLKKTLSFLPQLLIPLGAFVTLLSGYALLGTTSTPYFWTAACRLALAFIPLAAILALRVKIRKFPVWTIIGAFSAINCILAFVSPFTSLGFSHAFSLYLRISGIVTGAFVVLFAAYFTIKGGDAFSPLNPLLGGIVIITAAFLPVSVFTAYSPIFWLLDFIVIVALSVSFREFIGLERENRYLNANLQGEVARQTVALNSTIKERDKVLMFVSHDMKKPVLSLGSILEIIDGNANEELKEQTTAALKKYREIRENFDELSKFSKVNFVAEESTAFIANEVLSEISDYLKDDCAANGVTLSVVPSAVKAYAKRKNLSGVVYNLVMNSLEHAQCSEIVLTSRKYKNLCRIEVTDDGKGIDGGKDVFEPFISDKADESNVGLGLYLSKTTVEAMGGELTYTQSDGTLTFTITLPLA